MPFEAFGSTVWDRVRLDDKVGMDILRYFARRNVDHAECVMVMAMPYPEDFTYGAYHCLCGLGLLEPYIDKEGTECARLTEAGRDVIAC